ncbi:O-antigen ligase family protein [Cellulophaga baltica]|uniref:O-antigen ligase family protein n=1 Tax=Cellulophaga baltica TaxID=76594 RepID=UPI0015F5DA81|nr:O-antigen ligase family protein [Cellulophaga baltica]MBA6314709.1 O-antigen ligase family protein [Cellulophaga baltica]
MKKAIFLISFFSFSGYYVGLAMLFSLGLTSYSRFYSVPLRIILAVVMIYIIRKNIDNLLSNKFFKYYPIFIIFWAFYFFKVVYTESIVFDGSLGRAWYEYIFYSITFVIIPATAFLSIPFEKFKDTILNGFIASGFVLGLACLYLYGNLLGSGIGRLNMITYQTGETVLNPLSISYSGVLTLTLCVYKLFFTKMNSKYEKSFLYITILLSFVMFLLGSSRGSVIAIILSIPFFIIFSETKNKFKFIAVITISIPLIILAIKVSGSSIFERIGNTSEDKGGGREVLWSNALNHFLEHPFFGGRIEIGGIYPHNFIIETLMATGLLGISLIMPIIIKGLYRGYKISSIDNTNFFILLILINGLTQFSFSGAIWTSNLIFTPIAFILAYRPQVNNKI